MIEKDDLFLENLYETIWAIASSRYCSEYIVGYTYSANRRRRAYARNGWSYFVILADNLSQLQAIDLEKRLQARLKKEKSHVCYRKYNSKRRDLRHYPSTGGRVDPHGDQNSVYMVFRED